MKLISPRQHAKVRLRLEITASAILATVLVSTVILINTPGYGAALKQLVAS